MTKTSTTISLRSISLSGLLSLCILTNALFAHCPAVLTARTASSGRLLTRTFVFTDHQPAKLKPLGQAVTMLRPGEILTRSINGGENQFFKVSVAAGQYVRLLVQQHGIILTVTLLDANGRRLTTMDNPSGGHGPIQVSAIASASGDYRVEVRSTEDWANPGSFDVSVEELREARPEDKARVDAERAFAEGSRNNDAGTSQVAIDEYRKSLSYWQSVQDHHWEALTQYGLGQSYRKSENRSKAADCFNESLRILSTQMDQDDWRLKGAALNDLGLIYSLRGENEKAFPALNEALGIFEDHGDRRGQASALNNLAQTYERIGQLRKARELVERALPLRQVENFRVAEINLLNGLGIIDDHLGDTYQARDRFRKALAAWQEFAKRKPQDPIRLANAFNSLAVADDKLGDWDQALQYYDEALKLFSKNNPGRAATLDNKGELYAALGDLVSAVKYYDESISVIDSLERPDPDLKASILLHVGQAHIAKGELNEALAYFARARETKPNDPKLAYILTSMGAALAMQGNPNKALEVYQEALEIQLRIEDRRGEAITRQKKGEAYALLGRQADALKEFNLALPLWKALVDRRGEAATLNNMALIERDQNDLKEALQLSGDATKIIESMRTKVSSHQLRTSYFATQENYYELNIDLNMKLYQQGQSPESLATALQASERSRARSLMDTLVEAHANITEGPTGICCVRSVKLNRSSGPSQRPKSGC